MNFKSKKKNNWSKTEDVTYQYLPFTTKEDGSATFVLHEKSDGSYYLPMLPFLGHETNDVKEMFDRVFDRAAQLETIEERLGRFVDWLCEKHPFKEFTDIPDYSQDVKTCMGMFLNGKIVFNSIGRLNPSYIEEAKRELLMRYNQQHDSNVGMEEVQFKYRLFN